MKKQLLLIVFFFITISIFAQKSEYERLVPFIMRMHSKASEALKQKNYDQAIISSLELLDTCEHIPVKYESLKEQVRSGVYYNMACAYSLKGDSKQAVSYLAKSIDFGNINYAHMIADADLKPLQNDTAYIRQINRVKELGDYTAILKKAGKYNLADTKHLPKFKYQSKDDPNLKRVREYFNLDSVAGKGDEISRIKNLMTFVHNAVLHDGSSMSPDKKNAIDLYETCKKEIRGINCRMMAIMLNECYLAMGYKSRFVTCMPKSERDTDCHVINMVFSRKLNKWIWMDPTFNAYVSDEKGNLLGIADVRERIIKNKPLLLNKDANWNNKNKQTKEQYIDSYMAKNLYCFEIPTESRYNIETKDDSQSKPPYVLLFPTAYSRTDYDMNLVTHNPDYFWQKL